MHYRLFRALQDGVSLISFDSFSHRASASLSYRSGVETGALIGPHRKIFLAPANQKYANIVRCGNPGKALSTDACTHEGILFILRCI